MARIKQVSWNPEFVALQSASVAAGDNNDCFPKAIAALTGLDYEVVREAMKAEGRKDGRGTPWHVARAAAKTLGYDIVRSTGFEAAMIATYPGVHKNLKNITTRHPVRFAKQWAGQSCLLWSDRHVSAVVDGKMIDWAVNRSKHVMGVYRVVKL